MTDGAAPTMDTLALKHGTDKGSQRHDFARVYDSFLAAKRFQPVKVLELGVHQGASLRMWRDYFPEGQIWGVDIKPAAAAHAEPPRVKVSIGDQKDPELLDAILEECGPLDLVVDDGSHRQPEQLGSLLHLWPYIKPGGCYIVEDVHTSYFESYKMGYRQAGSTMEVLKDAVDDIHAHIHKEQIVLGDVAAMHFYYETCVIEKRR